MIRAIIWDFDGTLVDTYPAIARAYAIALSAFEFTAPFERIVELSSQSLDHCTQQLAADHNLPVAEFEALFQQAYKQITPADQPPFLGMLSVCEVLREAGWRQYIVTHRRRASLNVLLDAHGLAHYFADIIAGDDGFPRKPDPAAFLALCARHNLSPATTVTIGDRPADMQAARAAGLRGHLFGSSALECEPDGHASTASELLQLLVPQPTG